MKKSQKKLFVVKKYVWATSASQALKLENRVKADDCWIDDDWKKQQEYPKGKIGFKI